MKHVAVIMLAALLGFLFAKLEPVESKAVMEPTSVLPLASPQPMTAKPSLLQALSAWRTPDSEEDFQLAWANKPNRVLKRLLISEWVAFDAPSALDQAFTLAGEDRRLFLAEIFLVEPELGLKHLREISASTHPYWIKETVEAWLTQAGEAKPASMTRLAKLYQLDELDPAASIFADPARALAEAELIEDSKEREARISAVCQTWYRLDPIAAWKYAKEHLSPTAWHGLADRLFDDWMRKDPRTAFAFRKDLPMNDPSYWYERLGSHWGPSENFNETVNAVKATPEGASTKSMFVAALVYGGAVESSDQGFALLPHLPTDGQHQNGRLSLLGKIRDLLVEEQDAKAAAAWIAQLDNPYERLRLQQDLPDVSVDPSEFIDVFQKESDPDKIFDALSRLAQQPTFDTKALDTLLASIPTEHQQEACRQALEHLPPAEAFAFGEQFGGEIWDHQRGDVLSRWSEVDPKGALEALSSDDNSASWLLRRWYNGQASEVTTWVNAQTDPEWQTVLESARARAEYDQIRAQSYRGDVSSWPELLDRAASLPEKLSPFSVIVHRWSRVDPAAANAFLADPDNHARIHPQTMKYINKRQEFMDAIANLKGF